ncbi:MAG: hypothetical protein EPN21_00710 [Methylococcaceae bacterium]|nr:MAG: hypothetical protein EPN21_00710 [Methylococcaceae bacterium]
MNTPTTPQLYLQKLESVLADDFYAEGADLAAKTAHMADSLPTDLAEYLRDLAQYSRETGGDPLELAFRSGIAMERLAAYKKSRVDESLALAWPGDQPHPLLPEEEMDTLARLLAARDRVVKAVADFTFKALMVCLGLLVLWILVNLI